MIEHLMLAHWFVGLRKKKEESKTLRVGVQRWGMRFWLKGYQAKAQHIRHSHEL